MNLKLHVHKAMASKLMCLHLCLIYARFLLCFQSSNMQREERETKGRNNSMTFEPLLRTRISLAIQSRLQLPVNGQAIWSGAAPCNFLLQQYFPSSLTVTIRQGPSSQTRIRWPLNMDFELKGHSFRGSVTWAASTSADSLTKPQAHNGAPRYIQQKSVWMLKLFGISACQSWPILLE